MDTKPPSWMGDMGLMFWLVVGLAAAFVAYLVLDWFLARRRERRLRERWKRAAERSASVSPGE